VRKLKNGKKGVSTVIAAVIVVAVTIALAIAVAYRLGGLAWMFARFEKIEINDAYVTLASGTYTVIINYENAGATATSIDSILLNGVPTTSYTTVPTLAGAFNPLPASASVGVTATGTIVFPQKDADPSGNQLNSGVTCTIDLHSTGGKHYYASVTLP
jgi:flagellin-like protein